MKSLSSIKVSKKGAVMLALGLVCINDSSALAAQLTTKNKLKATSSKDLNLEDVALLQTRSSIKSRLNQQIDAQSLNLNSLSASDAAAFVQGLSQEQLLQTSQMLSATDGEDQAQAAPVADDQAAQVQAQDVQQAEAAQAGDATQ